MVTDKIVLFCSVNFANWIVQNFQNFQNGVLFWIGFRKVDQGKDLRFGVTIILYVDAQQHWLWIFCAHLLCITKWFCVSCDSGADCRKLAVNLELLIISLSVLDSC